jgi:hypothetical protein
LPSDNALAADSFVETFDGHGPYESAGGIRKGLDNPGWNFGGDGNLMGGGYFFKNAPDRDGSDSDRLLRLISDDCGYVERIEIRDVILGPLPRQGYPSNSSSLQLWHILEDAPDDHYLAISLSEFDESETEWDFFVFGEGPGKGLRQVVPAGKHIAMEIRVDKSQATFAYA